MMHDAFLDESLQRQKKKDPKIKKAAGQFPQAWQNLLQNDTKYTGSLYVIRSIELWL